MRQILLTDDSFRILIETLESIMDGQIQEGNEDSDEKRLLEEIQEHSEYIEG